MSRFLADPARLCALSRLTAVFAAALALIAMLWPTDDRASAHHAVHFNTYYWAEWAFSPLTAVNAYDCIDQNSALQGATNEWNATGLVLISTQLNNCNMSAAGIRWLQGGGTCNSNVGLWSFQQKGNYLDPDSWQPPTNRALQVNVNIGTGCPDSDSTCAGWYSPCDVLTHELGHALGLADHYWNEAKCQLPASDPSYCGPDYAVFSYPNPPISGTPVANVPTIMDYPHRTDITLHDWDDVNTLYRRAPFSPSNLDATAPNFHRMNLTWLDRSHNESSFYVERNISGGAYAFTGSTGSDVTSFSQDTVSPGQSYCFRAYGRNSWGGSGALSNSDCVTPPNAVGTGIAGSFPAGSTNIGLCWNPAPGNAGVTGYYVIRRRDNGNGTFTTDLYLESTATDCYGNGKVAWLGTVSSTTYKYHFAVKGCDGSWGCSNYKDMTSPSYQWVRLPWNGSGSTGSPSSGYHSH